MPSAKTTNTTVTYQVPSPFGPPFPVVVTMRVAYKNTTIDADDIFLTAIRRMAEAAEARLDKAVRAMATFGIRGCHWKLLGSVKRLAPILRYRHSREAVHRTIIKIGMDNKFRQIYVFMDVDGDMTATGRFDTEKAASIE